MTALVVAVAQDLLYALTLVVGLLWLSLDRTGKVRLAAAAAVGLAVVGLAIWAAGAAHVDPRPFVSDPNSAPLFRIRPTTGSPPTTPPPAGCSLHSCCGTGGRWV